MTNISRRLRKKYLRIAYDYGARVTIIHLDVPFATVLARNGTRDRMIPRDYLEDLWFELEFPLPYEAHRAWYVSGT